MENPRLFYRQQLNHSLSSLSEFSRMSHFIIYLENPFTLNVNFRLTFTASDKPQLCLKQGKERTLLPKIFFSQRGKEWLVKVEESLKIEHHFRMNLSGVC